MFHKKHFTCNMHTRSIGDIGENIACKYITNKGLQVIDRNYQKLWGELDIIAKKDKVIHFFEVKSVTASFSNELDIHRPEDNVHAYKLKHLRRIIETYLEDKGYGFDAEFYFHVLCVYMDMRTRKARVVWIDNIILWIHYSVTLQFPENIRLC